MVPSSDASLHLYPPALAKEVASRWSNLEPPGTPLPPIPALEQLFDALYQASLLTEETRPVRCRIMLAEPEAWPPCQGPPTGFHVLCFAQPHPLEAHELRKLSLAAAYHRGLLGVRYTPERGFEVWGMINSGARWVSRTDGGRFQGVPLPRHLVAHVTGPGRIAVSCGYGAVLTLAAPGVATEGLDPFKSQWLPHHFREVRTLLLERFAAERGDGALVENNFVRLLAQNVVRRTLSLVRDGGHGGILLSVPEGWLDDHSGPISLEGHLRFAPGKSTERFHSLMLDAMSALSRAAARHGMTTVGWSDYQNLNDPLLAQIDEAFFELAHLLADLMAVDGALVLSKGFDLLGFGAEVRGQLAIDYVHRAVDLEAEQTLLERSDRSGTRHRAAYRFAAGVPEGLAIVVSQDATVRFISQLRGKVTYWDYAP